jgi:hypothetical protein
VKANIVATCGIAVTDFDPLCIRFQTKADCRAATGSACAGGAASGDFNARRIGAETPIYYGRATATARPSVLDF